MLEPAFADGRNRLPSIKINEIKPNTEQQSRNITTLITTGLAEKKRLVMSSQNVFLGQVNDFSDMMSSNACAMVRAKPGRDVVIRGYVSEARD